ncbi:related to cholinesterase [Phialocephala subalpina]|uniref:Carboxylic ester hydrolase n=1 Tax=Phialocephala subalpina TaxID=576137 RepID=A0A1L7XKB6_9HELO|nr:related to cholinesterase [Phialocephala subalpina]
MLCNAFLSAIILAVASFGAPTSGSSQQLPIVDIGYDVHRASLNASGSYYNFTNIRYAQPPTGNLRFSPPLPPIGINKTVNDGGSVPIMCAQAGPAWEATAFRILGGANASQFSPNPPPLNLSSLPTAMPGEVEDCLFLDVMVPTSIFDKKEVKPGGELSASDKANSIMIDESIAPVMVWIFGGGFVSGSKTHSGNPAGILERAQENNGEGVIFVALNYRLGILGWLSGSTYQQNATSNLGLHDQALALKWIQNNIHLFGGDPGRVTVFGESAGGSSILAQLTAYGGTKSAPFKRAIMQSPAYFPVATNFQQEDTFNDVLSISSLVAARNISTTQELRELSEAQLYEINAAFVNQFPYGDFVLFPTVDGEFNTKLPEELLAHGQFDRSVEVMVGANGNEGAFFFNRFLKNESDFEAQVSLLLPGARKQDVKYITQTLYPPVYDGSFGYKTMAERIALWTSDLTVDCKAILANQAYNNSYSYIFVGPPGYHTQDVAYTFYNNGEEIDNFRVPVNATLAKVMQEYFINFATTGKPNANEKGAPFFQPYGSGTEMQILGLEGIETQVVDPKKIERCDWWQKALFY